jgi:signal transduction histidine kinase
VTKNTPLEMLWQEDHIILFIYNLASGVNRMTPTIYVAQVQPGIGIGDNFKTTYLNTDLFITIIVMIIGILVGMFLLTKIRTKQKREAEAFLESILHTTVSGIMSLKAVRANGQINDFKITFANRSILQFLHTTEDEISKKSLLQLNPLVTEEGIFEKYKEVTESGKTLRFQRTIGQHVFYVLVAKLNDGVTASFYNISDLKETEQKLNAKIQELENINLELEQFAYVTSHDLQEPLRKINMFADIMLQASTEKENYFHLSSIIRCAGRMRKLIQKLSEYSKIRNNNFMFRQVDLNEIIRELLQVYEDKMLQYNTALVVSNLPIVYGIPLQIYTMFDNLINNAIKFSKTGARCIIQISGSEPHSSTLYQNENLNRQLRYAEIVFKDNGTGFDPAYADKIFGIFQQLERRATTEDVGIGLALCLKIARVHQGDIYAVSTLQEGSEFHIFLPLQSDPA